MMQTELSNLASTDKSTAGLILTNLLKRHSVERHTDPADRRRKQVIITDSGRAALELAKDHLVQAEAVLLDALEPAERALLMSLLQRLASQPAGQHSVSWLMRRCLQAVEALLSDEAGLFGLTLRQFCALLIVFCHPGINEATIRKLLGYEISNAALVVGLLRDKGLISSKVETTGSRRRYYATTIGRDVLLTVEPKLSAVAIDFVNGVSEDDVTRLQQLLGILILRHGDKLKAPLAVFEQVVKLPTWPLPPAHTYAVEHRDELSRLNNQALRLKE